MSSQNLSTFFEIIEDMCAGQYVDDKNNVGNRSKLPPQLWLVDSLQRNMCPLGHKTQRHDQFLQALYAFHKGHWYSIPSIIWNQINKFWDWVHWLRATTTNSWGLPFPFLLTHILKKKGIKGTSEDGPVKEHPFFGRNQWNQSQSHMPRGIRAPVPAAERVEELEPMEEEEPAAQQGGGKGPVVIGYTEYEFLCDEMSYFKHEIAKIRWEDREDTFWANQRMDRLEKCIDNLEKCFDRQEGMLKAILDQLPPATGASSSTLLHKFNCTRQLHELFVIERLCKCEVESHRELCLLKTNSEVPKIILS
jgi:hypothetical protein